MFNLRGIKALFGEYKCFVCNQSQYFSEKVPCEKDKELHCIHHKIIITFKILNGLKISVKNKCQNCNIENGGDLKICTNDSEFKVIKDDIYKKECCGNRFELKMCLSEQYFDKNEDIKYFINNFDNSIFKKNINNNSNNNIKYNNSINNSNFILNPFSMTNNNMNMLKSMYNPNFNLNLNNINMNMNMNNSINNNNLFMNNIINNFNNNFSNNINNNINNNFDIKFDTANIMEFGKKVQLLNFLDNKTKKKYQIYTCPDLKFKNVLNDLLNQYPEINYNNINLQLNGIVVNLEANIKNIISNDNSIIVIKTY